MSTAQLAAAIQPQGAPLAQRQTKPLTFPEMLMRYKGEIAVALPKHLNAERMARIALSSFRQNKKLASCTPESVFASIILASQLGLEPGVMGQCYLIPYKDQCTLQIGYQGLLDLAQRTGRIRSIEAHVVHKNDKFHYEIGADQPLSHTPELFEDPGPPILAYAIAKLDTGTTVVEVMTRRQIEAIRDRSQNVMNAKTYGKKTPWDTDSEEMWRKTLIRRICKYLPKSVELALATQLVDATGKQNLDLNAAINMDWAPPALPAGSDDDADDDDAGDNTDAAQQQQNAKTIDAKPQAETKPAPAETKPVAAETKPAPAPAAKEEW
jgi:recombination protein RecT